MLKINSSNTIELTVTNPLLVPVHVNDAVVTITITDSSGVELGGVTWPQTLLYVASSEGLYRETFAPFTELVEGAIYTIHYLVTGIDGLIGTCKAEHKATDSSCC